MSTIIDPKIVAEKTATTEKLLLEYQHQLFDKAEAFRIKNRLGVGKFCSLIGITYHFYMAMEKRKIVSIKIISAVETFLENPDEKIVAFKSDDADDKKEFWQPLRDEYAYGGKLPYNRKKVCEIVYKLKADGLSLSEISKQINASRTYFYVVLKNQNEKPIYLFEAQMDKLKALFIEFQSTKNRNNEVQVDDAASRIVRKKYGRSDIQAASRRGNETSESE